MPHKKREIPKTFMKDYLTMTQVQLQKKYKIASGTIAEWSASLGKEDLKEVEPRERDCVFRRNITCESKDGCAICGWNPEEQKRVMEAYDSGRMPAVRSYIRKRGRKNVAECGASGAL